MNALKRVEQRGIQIGEQRGIQLGRKEGRSEVTRNIARQMLAESEHIIDIARWTGLTPEQILALKD